MDSHSLTPLFSYPLLSFTLVQISESTLLQQHLVWGLHWRGREAIMIHATRLRGGGGSGREKNHVAAEKRRQRGG